MADAVYSIRRISWEKWKLYKGDAELGTFETYDDAYSAMKLVVNPQIAYFDAEGNELGESPRPGGRKR